MKKVYLIHGFEGRPNNAWRPYLMRELDEQKVYACALPMPSPEKPQADEWIAEIARVVERDASDEIYLVGHSLGVPAILRVLESTSYTNIHGAVLVSGPVKVTQNAKIENFLLEAFDYSKIMTRCPRFTVFHGSDDPWVSFDNAETLSTALNCKLVSVQNGKHLNGSAGFNTLPECLDALNEMFATTL